MRDGLRQIQAEVSWPRQGVKRSVGRVCLLVCLLVFLLIVLVPEHVRSGAAFSESRFTAPRAWIREAAARETNAPGIFPLRAGLVRGSPPSRRQFHHLSPTARQLGRALWELGGGLVHRKSLSHVVQRDVRVRPRKGLPHPELVWCSIGGARTLSHGWNNVPQGSPATRNCRPASPARLARFHGFGMLWSKEFQRLG